jgi:ATP-binding cassette subfamily F protein 3
MSLVNAQDLSVAFGERVLFDGAGFVIGPTDRLGLVGANGTGKSTLMKILAGQIVPDAGTLVLRRGARVGYLPQDLAALPEGALVEMVLGTVPGHDALRARLADTEAALARAEDPTEQLELAQQLADLHTEVEHFEERYGRHRAERILAGLGFRTEDLVRPTSEFSGGWRMRAALAGLLLQDPDLLLLDEPTNHLDLPTLAWFDDFLRRSRKALVLISHDRDFLNRQIGRVLSLEIEGLRSYPGTYDDYRRHRAEEMEQLVARAENVAAKRAALEAFVARFRAKATKARQAQSRVKMLERLETVELQQERARVQFAFPEVARSGREVATFTQVRKAYGARVIYDGLEATIQRGQRVAVVGMNGAGKTTLLKLLAGESTPDGGTVTLGHNVVLGYYAQHHGEALDRNATILEEVAKLAPDKPQSFVRGVLGSFLFSGDDVDKKIAVLSGGERARVALAKLLLVPSNLLVMDEPTNHLDLDSSEALIEALKGYGGTLVFVSHNRSFLNQLATEVWDVREQRVVPYPGNLDDYLYHLQQAVNAAEQSASADGAAAKEAPRAVSERDRRRAEAEARQRRSALEGPLKREIASLETAIAALEATQKEREGQLADPALYDDFARARPIIDAHNAARSELEALYVKWEDAQARLAAAQG